MDFEKKPEFIIGKKGEEEVFWIFKMSGRNVMMANDGSYKDIIVDDFLVEIKNEIKHSHTGNLCIETYQGKTKPKRKSGINITRSDFWIHLFNRMVAIYKTLPMKNWLNANHDFYMDIGYYKEFGDNGNEGYIIPIRHLKDKNIWFGYCNKNELANNTIMFPHETYTQNTFDMDK